METANHECYVSLEVAKLLKQAGFDWKCTAYYENGELSRYSLNRDGLIVMNFNANPDYMCEVSAPTLAVAQRWLREVKGRLVLVGSVPEYFFCTIYEYKRKIDHIFIESNSPFDTYEEALEAGINKCLTLLLKEE